jgi:putative tricarboxylic transport membrane protein
MGGTAGKMKRILVFCNSFWILFSLFTCTEAYRLGLGSVSQPGPGFFPFAAGTVMLLACLTALLRAAWKKEKADHPGGEKQFRWWNIVIILAAITAYALSLEKIGFLVNTFVFMCLLLKVIEPQPWKTSIIGALITTVAANVIFNIIFQAQIPPGILGF